jgi:hypothetical protein
MSVISKGLPAEPIEKNDTCPRGQRFAFRRPDGTVLVREQPCDTRSCEVCGPRLRRRKAQEWAHAMDGDTVYCRVMAEADWARLRRTKAVRDGQWATIPQLGGVRVVYNTAGLGQRLERVAARDVAADLAGMPPERRSSMSKGWLAVIADAQAEEAAAREPWECLGRCRQSLAHVEMVAVELGVLVGRAADMVVVAKMDAQVEGRFLALCRVHRGRRRKAVAA